MAGRKVSGKEEAVALLAEVERSGRPLAACARAAGVDGRSLRMWRTNLSRAGHARSQPAVRLVELVPPAPVARYRVMCGEFVVEVDAGFDDAVLRRLLGVVATC